MTSYVFGIDGKGLCLRRTAWIVGFGGMVLSNFAQASLSVSAAEDAAMMVACGYASVHVRKSPFAKTEDGWVVREEYKWEKGSPVSNIEFSATRARDAQFSDPLCELYLLNRMSEQSNNRAAIKDRCEAIRNDLYMTDRELAEYGGSADSDSSFSALGNVFSGEEHIVSGKESLCRDSEAAFACAYEDIKDNLESSNAQKKAAKQVKSYCQRKGADMQARLTGEQYKSMANAGMDVYGGSRCGPIIVNQKPGLVTSVLNTALAAFKVGAPLWVMWRANKYHEQNVSQQIAANASLGYPGVVGAGNYGFGYGGYGMGGYGMGGGGGFGYGGLPYGAVGCGMGYPGFGGPCGYGYGYGNGGMTVGHGGYPWGYPGGGACGGGCGGGMILGGGGYYPGMGGGYYPGMGGGMCGMPPYLPGYGGCGGGMGGGYYPGMGGGMIGGGGLIPGMGGGGMYGRYPGGYSPYGSGYGMNSGLPGPFGTMGGGNGWSPYGTMGGMGGYGGWSGNPYGVTGSYGPGGMYGAVPYGGGASPFNAGAVGAQAQYLQAYAAQYARQAQQAASAAKIYQNNLRDIQQTQDMSYQSYAAYSMAQSGVGSFGGGYMPYGYGGGGGFTNYSNYYGGMPTYYPPYSSAYGSMNGLAPSTGGSGFSLGISGGYYR